MTTRVMLSMLLLTGLYHVTAGVHECQSLAGAEQYNVVFIIADDLNVDLGCYGNPVIKSPHIDALAQESVVFENAYCQYPLCNPSRASFLTGLRPDQSGVTNNATFFRNVTPDLVTLPQYFLERGYAVARTGKLYHYGVPTMIGTDGLDDHLSWGEVFNPIGRDKADEALIFTFQPGQFGGTLSYLAADGDDSEQTDAIGAAYANRYLDKHKDEPFFLACGFFRPHTPYVAPKKYFDLYPLSDIKVPVLPEDHDSTHPPVAYANRKKYEEQMTEEDKQKVIQAYYASISFMDAQVGAVIDQIKALGLWEKTIVVMTSDHGYHMGEHNMWQKMSVYQKSAQVPLIIHHPLGTTGRVSDSFAELVDLYPTLVESCGFEVPLHCQGESLLAQLKDPSAAGQDFALSQVDRSVGSGKTKQTITGYALSTARYRYIEWGQKARELYDFQKDKAELHNLADDVKYKPILDELSGKLHAILESE